MAIVDLHLHEIEVAWLPPVCARCAADGPYVRALAMILPLTAIRISDLAGTALTLTGVSEAFCDAVAQRRLEQSTGAEAIPKRTCTACGGLSQAAVPTCYHCGQ